MKTIELKTGNGTIELSRIILGTVNFGSSISEEQALRVIDRYMELGGRTIDTSRVYGDWKNTGDATSERVVGKWLKTADDRKKYRIITKGAHPKIMRDSPSRVRPEDIREDIELSLAVFKRSCCRALC